MQYSSILQHFLNNSARHPNRVFLNQPIERKWHLFTWGQVEHYARCIASGLKAQGFEAGDRIAILSKNCAEWFIVDMAITMAGMVSVPIYATASRSTISYILKHSQAKAVFVGKLDSLDAAEQGINGDTLRIAFPYPTVSAHAQWNDWLTDYGPIDNIALPAMDDTATIVYTSGSTGVPKGVVISHRNPASAVHCSVNALEAGPEDRCMSYLPLAHITERCVIEGMAFCSGCEVFFVESLDTFIDDVKHAKPTAFVSVPRLWLKFQSQILAKIPQRKLNWLLPIPILGKLIARKIRAALGLDQATRFGSGSAPISPGVLAWYQKLGICISEGWGMTETSGLSCGNLPFEKQRLGTIGKPLDCIEMKLSPDGEVLVRGDAVFSSYYLDPEKTAEAFEDGWFRTGDQGQVDAQGDYRIVGRLKEQFKTAKGKYVVPVPIESRLSACQYIEQVCVMGLGLRQPVALVVLADTVNGTSPAIERELMNALQRLNQELESHQRLDFMMICDDPWTIENELLTPTLKIKRNLLEARYGELITRELSGQIVWEKHIR